MKNLRVKIILPIVFLIISAVVISLVISDEKVITVSVTSKPVEILEPVIKTKVDTKNSISSYRGLGAWVDSFDADPNYLRGSSTALKPDAIEAHKRPNPPLKALRKLEECKPKGLPWRAAGTDSSDGLLNAINNLCKSSKCMRFKRCSG